MSVRRSALLQGRVDFEPGLLGPVDELVKVGVDLVQLAVGQAGQLADGPCIEVRRENACLSGCHPNPLPVVW